MLRTCTAEKSGRTSVSDEVDIHGTVVETSGGLRKLHVVFDLKGCVAGWDDCHKVGKVEVELNTNIFYVGGVVLIGRAIKDGFEDGRICARDGIADGITFGVVEGKDQPVSGVLPLGGKLIHPVRLDALDRSACIELSAQGVELNVQVRG